MSEAYSISSEKAYQAICVLMQQQPWFSTSERHLEANRCIELLVQYTKQQELKEKIQAVSNSNLVK